MDIHQLVAKLAVGSSTGKLESLGSGKFGVFEWDGSRTGTGVSGFGIYEVSFYYACIGCVGCYEGY